MIFVFLLKYYDSPLRQIEVGTAVTWGYAMLQRYALAPRLFSIIVVSK